MDIERSPVVDDVVFRRRHGDHTHFRMLAKQGIADPRPFSRLVESDHYEIRQGFPHALEDLRLLGDFADNFNVRLVSKGRENGFAHKARVIRDKDPDALSHGTLPAGWSISAAGGGHKHQSFSICSTQSVSQSATHEPYVSTT